MKLPSMLRLKQHFRSPRLDDIAGTVRAEVRGLALASKVQPGDSVAVTVGSRGIANIALITKTLVEEMAAIGLTPFIVPAMGSHGGGDAEQQRAIIEGYGVTEEYVGVPIRSSMETVQVGSTEEGVAVHFDKNAYQADHVVVVGRIKPHTEFVGDLESGLHKMMLIGLGKHTGAKLYHNAIVHHSFERIVRSVADQVIERCSILMGLGIVENHDDETAIVRAVLPADFYEREKELLRQAKDWLPRLPFQHADLLIIDAIGKNISGTGMDTNVVGRKFHFAHAAEDEYPKITRIFIRNLTPETKGNASGIGLSEFTHQRVLDAMDREMTYINCLTSNHPTGAATPIHYAHDRLCIEKALTTIGLSPPEDAKVIRIHDTLHLGDLLVSTAYRSEIDARDDLTIGGEAAWDFDDNDDLPLSF